MQNLSPASRYQLALNVGTHQPDDVQREAVNRLEMIYQELTAKPAEVEQNGGLKRRCAVCICGAGSVAEKPG